MRAVALLSLAVALAACGQPGHAPARTHVPQPTPGASSAPPAMVVAEPNLRPLELASSGPPGPPTVHEAHAAPPARLRIPAIGVDSGLSRLGLNPDGSIEVPGDFNEAGWYAKGPAPGEAGPAVMLGHLDSSTGPGVFARLSSLRPGSEVLINRTDGSQVRFVVERISSVPSDQFPTEEVYGATTRPALRLITCGGHFSLAQRRYSANVVAFAVQSA